jgi:hypothetical protein
MEASVHPSNGFEELRGSWVARRRSIGALLIQESDDKVLNQEAGQWAEQPQSKVDLSDELGSSLLRTLTGDKSPNFGASW